MQLIYGSGVFVLPTGDYVKWALLLHWVGYLTYYYHVLSAKYKVSLR